MSDIEIRQYRTTDWKSAIEVYEHLCSFYGLQFDLEKSKKFFSKRNYFQQYYTLVAFDLAEKKVVGLSFSEIVTEATQETCGYIKLIYVEEEYRTQGTMTALIDKSIQYFKEIQMDKVGVYLQNENLPFLNYYFQKFGMSPIATIVIKKL
jgi:GNAT superfamily N-acetyltransferase